LRRLRGAACLAIFAGLLACPGAEQDPRSSGTLEMIDRLRRIDEQMDVQQNPYESARRALMYEALARAETRPEVKLDWMRRHAIELLNAGESLRAAERFEAIEQEEARLGDSHEQDLRTTQILKAMSWLRHGEQENCITNHTIDSCLLPIQGRGIHQLRRGSTEARTLLTRILEKDPERLDARWLLNIASMTLGDYPQGVPERWRVPPERFTSDYDIGRFTDVADDLGLAGNAVSGGVIIEDFNNDGFLDLLVSAFGLTDQVRFFVNAGDGTFTERTREAGLEGLTGGLNLIQADYDNDGFVDVLMLRGAWLGRSGRIPNSLLRNNGDGTFSDVTRTAGMAVARPTQTAVFLDYDGDGWLDLFIGNESHGTERHRCELYRNNRDGTFTEVSFASGITIFEMVKGVTAGDFNNDGRPDLLISIMGANNQLLRNDGPIDPADLQGGWRFTDVTEAAGIRGPEHSFPCWFFDYDNDGWEDILIAGYNLLELDDAVAEIINQESDGDRVTLYRNLRDGTFEDVSEELGLSHALLAMGANFGDLDNDGWLDLYFGTGNPDLRSLVPNKMYRNNAGRGFQDVTTSGGFGHLQKGHGIAFADLDHDGDQDVYANMGGAFTGDVYRNALFANPGHGNRWLKLRLEGVTSNRSAVGARIKVVVQTPAGERSIYKTVNSGGSFGANPLRQELGLGDATALHRVEIFWPATGRTQTLRGLEPNQAYRIKEDAAAATRLDLRPTPFKKPTSPGHHHHH
jgi:hypothetical protein